MLEQFVLNHEVGSVVSCEHQHGVI